METAFHYPSPCAVPFFFKKKEEAISLVVDLLKPFATSSPNLCLLPTGFVFPSPIFYIITMRYGIGKGAKGCICVALVNRGLNPGP